MIKGKNKVKKIEDRQKDRKTVMFYEKRLYYYR